MDVVRTQVRIPKEIIDWLKLEAKQDNRSMNAKLVQILEQGKEYQLKGRQAKEVEVNKEALKQYPLRLPETLKSRVDDLAHSNRRSTNAELIVLIEDGVKYRKMQEIGYVR